jgi:predicted DNA binding CopG/RHH family protein
MDNKIDFKVSEIEYLGKQELSYEEDAKINKMIEQADKEIEETRINIRWQKAQLELIKKAAGLIGIPYQIYIRDIVFRKSVEDIEKFSKVLNKNVRITD